MELDKTKIYTSCWQHYRGEGRIGISRGTPRFNIGRGYRLYKKLAPTREILQQCDTLEAYEPRFYDEVLNKLDPVATLAELRRLVDGHAPVLLCFEKPPLHAQNFCHRTMVGDWLAKHTGVVVEEWSGIEESNPKQPTLDV